MAGVTGVARPSDTNDLAIHTGFNKPLGVKGVSSEPYTRSNLPSVSRASQGIGTAAQDNCHQRAARHAEVARRYAWGETHGRVHAPHRLVVVNRARELSRFLSYRYGDTLPDDDAGRDDLELLLSYVMQLNPGNGVSAMVREARAWAPWLRREDARALAERIAEGDPPSSRPTPSLRASAVPTLNAPP
jgi:hypothetical protein